MDKATRSGDGKSRSKVRFEFSAGGIVREGSKVLMVKVENLEGAVVWTFPKGHIEPGEKAPEAALREVQEETGYEAKIISPFDHVEYFFKRQGELVKKVVTWFLMEPVQKVGTHDAEEILATEWVSLEEAQKRARYKSDQQLLSKLREER